MANSTTQADVMMTLKGNLEVMFRDRDDVFVAMDLFWYPVKGKPKIRLAPDVLVALGRPKGPRRSYKQWEEDNIPPQVVFEVLSEANTPAEMREKFRFYQRYGVQEYYIYDPDTGRWEGYLREGEKLEPIPDMEGWVSPRLGIRFERGYKEDPGVYDTEGNRFVGYVELRQALEAAIERERQRREEAQRRAEQERLRAEQERLLREQAERRLAELEAELRRLRGE